MGGEAGDERFEHHPLTGRDLAQARQLVREEGACVGVGEQAGLLQHESAHRSEVVNRGRVPLGGEPVARDRVAQLGPLAEREQRLVAPGIAAGAGDRRAPRRA